MKANQLKQYHFANAKHWQRCLVAQADTHALQAHVIRPLSPFQRTPSLIESKGAVAPVITCTGDVLWRDDLCNLHRRSSNLETSYVSPTSHSLSTANRIVAAGNNLWAYDQASGSLELFEAETLSRLLTVEAPRGTVRDIAAGEHGTVLALVIQDHRIHAIRIGVTGRQEAPIEFQGIPLPTAFVYLRQEERFVVLAGEKEYSRLYWFNAEGGKPFFSTAVSGMQCCFEATILGSDGDNRVFLAGEVKTQSETTANIIIFDADANQLDVLPVSSENSPAQGVTGNKESLYLAGKQGLLQYRLVDAVPEGAQPVECKVMTPILISPDQEGRRRWLRIEALASLPDGCTLNIAWAATDQADVLASWKELLANDSIPASLRLAQLQHEPVVSQGNTTFTASPGATATPKEFSAKLFDVKEPYLLVWVKLTAPAHGKLPTLSELNVFYPNRSLMEDLPAIYRREEETPDSFLRSLVGVLETTTQGLDARIHSLGSRIHPKSAPEPWLDFTARWLGIPWDDAIKPEQKRELVQHAAELAKHRGTRIGLEILLSCLFPGKARCFRIIDILADYGFAVMGGSACKGSRLPAVLGGYSRWNASLDAVVLGHSRLRCPETPPEDGVSHLVGKLVVEVAASPADRRASQPWLHALVSQMVPFNIQVDLRWIAPESFNSDLLDDSLTLKPNPSTHLDEDAVTDQSRLPETPLRLTSSGIIVETHLRSS